MTDTKFDLQLFAEETADVAPEVEQPTEDSTGEEHFDFAIDEDGTPILGEDFLNSLVGETPYSDDAEQEGEEEHQEVEQPVEDSTEGNEPEPEKFIVTVGGQEQEVTLDELLHGYMRQADYSRKTQALADERNAYQQQVQQQAVQAPQQPQEQQQAQSSTKLTQKEYYEQLTKYAESAVENILGEEYDPYNPAHQAVYSDSIAKLNADIYKEQERQAAIQAREEQFMGVVAKYQQDPNFNAINMLAEQRLNEMPYKQAIAVKEAFDKRDVGVIDDYMAYITNEFYAQQQPSIRRATPQAAPQQAAPQVQVPKIKPPYVEQSGPASKPPVATTQQIDMKKLGTMSMDDQARLFSQLGLTKL